LLFVKGLEMAVKDFVDHIQHAHYDLAMAKGVLLEVDLVQIKIIHALHVFQLQSGAFKDVLESLDYQIPVTLIEIVAKLNANLLDGINADFSYGDVRV